MLTSIEMWQVLLEMLQVSILLCQLLCQPLILLFNISKPNLKTVEMLSLSASAGSKT